MPSFATNITSSTKTQTIAEDTYLHKGQRKKLIDSLRAKGNLDQVVLAAMEAIPRHIFFESALAHHAYEDKAFPIGAGQTISQPYTVAFQSTLLEPKPGHKILEIGTGSGYQSCVLSHLGAVLYTIEYHASLSIEAQKRLIHLGYAPHMYVGDGTHGLPAEAPFDRILVTAGGPAVPESLRSQLKIGGIMVIPVGDEKKQIMKKITKKPDGDFVEEEYGSFVFVKLVGKEGW